MKSVLALFAPLALGWEYVDVNPSACGSPKFNITCISEAVNAGQECGFFMWGDAKEFTAVDAKTCTIVPSTEAWYSGVAGNYTDDTKKIVAMPYAIGITNVDSGKASTTCLPQVWHKEDTQAACPAAIPSTEANYTAVTLATPVWDADGLAWVFNITSDTASLGTNAHSSPTGLANNLYLNLTSCKSESSSPGVTYALRFAYTPGSSADSAGMMISGSMIGAALTLAYIAV